MRNRREIEEDLRDGQMNESDIMIEVLLDIRDFVSLPGRALSTKQREAISEGIDNYEPEESKAAEKEPTGADTERRGETEEAGSPDNTDGV